MNKKHGKLILFLLVTASVFILTGCGGSLDTKLTVHEDLSGERQMTFTLDKADNQNAIRGNAEDIKANLTNTLPDALTMEDRSAGGNIELVFTLKFSDMDDYENKIYELYRAGGGMAPADPVVWYKPDTVFAKGVSIEEHFNSKDLMVWFQNYLVSSGYVSEKDRQHIFETTSCEYDICGETGNATPVVVDSLKYAPFDSINIYTDFNGPSDIDRKIEVVLPQSSMDFNGDEIRAFFDDRVASGFEGEWSDRSGDAVFTISGNGLNADDVNDMMNAFCGIDDLDMFYISKEATLKYGGEKVTAGPDGFVNIANVFGESSGVAENLDLSDFVYDRSGTINLNYYVDDAEEYNGAVRLADKSEVPVANDQTTGGEDGYNLFFNTDQAAFEVEYAYTYKYRVDEMEITLAPKRKGDVSREVTAHFANKVDKTRLDSIQKETEDCFRTVNEKLGTGEDDLIVLKSIKSDDNGFKAVIATNVKADAGIRESDLWNMAFGSDNKLSFTADTKAILPLFATMHVEDRFDTGIFSGSEVATIAYTIKGIGKPVFDGDTVNAVEKTGVTGFFTKNDPKLILTDVDPEQPVTVSFTGKKLSIIAAIIWGVAAIFLIFGIISVIIFIKNRRDDRIRPVVFTPDEKDESASGDKNDPKAPAQDEGKKIVEGARPGTVICPGCGKILAKGTLFCGMCGYKL